jgi:hypothetical protein
MLLAMAFLALAAPAYAQPDNSYRYIGGYSASEYKKQVDHILRGDPPGPFNITALRVFYPETAAYDPSGEQAIEKLHRAAFRVQKAKDEKVAETALAEYWLLLTDHMGNIAVVTEALALSRQDPRFGDPEILEKLRQGHVENIMNSGDGKTLSTAYTATTLADDEVLLRGLGVKYVSVESAHSGAVYYNMYEVEDAKGERRTIFTDISKPMRFLEEKRKHDIRQLDLRYR